MENERKFIVKYPVGDQSFESIRSDNYLYIDKTRYIDRLVNQGSKYYFLGRPRRFGKSLFLSTLQCFFEGKRHLFKGTYIDSTDWKWEKHPVLYLDLNIKKYKEKGDLNTVLDYLFGKWEEKYSVAKTSEDFSVRFSKIIEGAYKASGDKGVVVLVDEYDKPLVNNLHDDPNFKDNRDTLAEIYSNFKSSAPFLRLVFITGISRFAKLSVFCGLNNLNDITFDVPYSGICGITEEEFAANFQDGLNRLAEEQGMSVEETHDKVKRLYDGYHFSSKSPDVYNPFSLMNLMEKLDFRNYWIDSGTPSLLWDQLRDFDVDLKSLINSRSDMQTLQGIDLENHNPVALLYQTGYLTIKKTIAPGMFQLGLPNGEVKDGFMNFLLPHYANLHGETSQFFIYDFVDDLREGRVDAFMSRLQKMFAGISYEMHMDCEKNLHNAILVLMLLLGQRVKEEFHTSDGRIDLFLRTDRYYYVIEIKIDKTAQDALNQINDKNYSLPFSAEGRKIIKIGVNFDTAKRTLSDWIVEL